MMLSLSRVYMPFVYQRNPHINLVSSQRAEDAPSEAQALAAFLFPHASSTRFEPLTEFIDFCFQCRDLVESCRLERGDLEQLADDLASCVDAFRTGVLPRSPHALHRRAQRVGRALAPLQTSGQQTRLVQALADHLFRGALEMLKLDRAEEVPDIRSYREIRQFEVAVHTIIELVELAVETTIGSGPYRHPKLRRMRREVCLQIAMANDILSSQEVFNGGASVKFSTGPESFPCNMIQIVARQRGVDLEQATLEVVEMANHHIWAFIDLERKLPCWGNQTDAEIKLYAQAMKDLMGGNWYWSLEGSRFHSKASPFAELRTPPGLLPLEDANSAPFFSD